MKILVVGNGGVTKVKNDFLKDKHTGTFLEELSILNDFVYLQEFVFEAKNNAIDLHTKKLPKKNFLLLGEVLNLNEKSFRVFSHLKSIVRVIFFFKKIDIIYIFLPGRTSLIIGLLAVIFRKKMGIYLRADYPRKNIIYKFLLEKANFILVTGSYFRNLVLEYNSNTYIVSTMMDLTSNDIYTNKVIKKDVTNLLYVGRIQKEKGIWTLIAALEQLLVSDDKKYFINIIGGGAELDIIRAYVKEKKLSSFIKIHGLISDKKELKQMYYKADIFILPSLQEGFPRVLYEAMTYAVPIITTFVGSIPSLMINKYNCLEISINNQKSIVETIKLLADNYELRNEFSQNGIKTMQGFFASKSKLSHAQQVTRLAKSEQI
jgi:glycosyltransferase involved in cell wall biosynthesis